MAFWQYKDEWKNKALGFGSEEGYDLPDTGYLSGLLIRIGGDHVSNSTPNTEGQWTLDEFISKIQVVANGSMDLVNLTGLQAAALAYMDHRTWGQSPRRNYATANVWVDFAIPFGRFMWDPSYGLDLSKFDQVRVQIANVANSTYWTTDLDVTIRGLYFRETGGNPFAGYYRKQAWNKWTTTQAGYNYVKLPVDGMLRRIVLQCIVNADTAYDETTAFTNLMRDLKIYLRSQQVTVFDGMLSNLLALGAFYRGDDWDHAQEAAWTKSDYGHLTRIGYPLGSGHMPLSRSGSGSSTIVTLTAGENQRAMLPDAISSTYGMQYILCGLGPMNCVEVPFDIAPFGPEGLNLQTEATVEVHMQAQDASAAASGTDYVITDRLIVG